MVEDGHGHFLAVIPFGDSVWDHLYWSPDGKDFWQQRVSGGGSSGTESFDRVFWEPRVRERWRGSFGMKEGVYTVYCGERTTTLKPAGSSQGLRHAGRGAPPSPRWKYRAYALARDDSGTLLLRGPPPRGREHGVPALIPVSGGRCWSSEERRPIWCPTRRGTSSPGPLRGAPAGPGQEAERLGGEGQAAGAAHVAGGGQRPLIYSDFGVYSGQPLGTPCDLL